MIRHFIELAVIYFFVPYSMILFAGFGFFGMRDCIKSWLRERRAEQAAKKSESDKQSGGAAK